MPSGIPGGDASVEWINIFGLVFIVIIMIPNIISVKRHNKQICIADYCGFLFCSGAHFDFL